MPRNTIKYLNMRGVHGVETVYQLESKDFATHREFIKESRRLISEYQRAGMSVYPSSRCTNDWKQK